MGPFVAHNVSLKNTKHITANTHTLRRLIEKVVMYREDINVFEPKLKPLPK